MRTPRFFAFSLLSVTIAACGGSEGDPGPAISGEGGTGGEGPGCLVEEDYGDLGAAIGGMALLSEDEGGAKLLGIQVAVGGDEQTLDVMQMFFREQRGVFAEGFAPGMITIEGAETDSLTCGLCSLFFADLSVEPTFSFGKVFFASSGSVTIDTIDAVSGGMLTLSMSDLTFREVLLDPNTGAQTDVPNGCTTTIGALSVEGLPVVLFEDVGEGAGDGAGPGDGAGDGSGGGAGDGSGGGAGDGSGGGAGDGAGG
jgi:hypothetical protein